MNAYLTKSWGTVHGMIDAFFALLPKLILAIVVFVLFWFGGTIVNRLLFTPVSARNLSLVLGRIAHASQLAILGLRPTFEKHEQLGTNWEEASASTIIPTATAKQEQDNENNQNRFQAFFLDPLCKKPSGPPGSSHPGVGLARSFVLLANFSSTLRMPTLTGDFRTRFDRFTMRAAILTIFRRETTATGVSTAVFVLFVHKWLLSNFF